ncbi:MULTISPECIES: 50S ribosomal protein L25/general stress protein Ctc [Paenarthrobacter]|uniref:Large ribosomal subunit protein bL25 n=1 Tax=Paenarthrobacter ureafaciens TaxID=37931 RepID=A0AAX3ELI7_PAEUR|nr:MULTISPECIES: 50S ribosomal protein L25/general stress protein Ctc [Paenarthrobacter]NKR11013.1 50S ribosomal protein L25/general stress protein Ctc [Arthrobacter sp. M5]NKR17470.1 50S ribosomal protein L25/general stress protein Ctc [Arthrobacter sp. M6]OEH64006.1 50S ribosomal protein L25/general stress protein Ctc [Arthrobacter sp. D4]OEH64682.1 50S ribosomal protein L25/general stress protein Ctc [Arthrobacter sp. D2]MDO5863914.1 50S ribosomal protein L25/general stress protein Ctc [Pae
MSEQKLAAELRTEFGKGYARRARVAGRIPAVIYGHGAEPVHVTLPGRETTLAVRVANALLNLDINGEAHLTIVKDIQRNAIKQTIEHMDLLTVRHGEKVTVDVPVHVTGEVAPGAVANQEAVTISVEAEATHLPTALEVDIEGREAGAHVHASDVVLPKGVSLLTEADTLVVNISEATASAAGEEAAEGEEAPAAEEAAE